MAKYKAYPEYKDSGVEWLGGVPEHWKTLTIKHVAQLNPSKSCISIEKMKGMCSFIPMEKLKFNSLSLDEVKYISDVYNGYTYFENEDIIIAKVTPCFENKNMVVAHDLNNGIGFGSSEIYVLRCNNTINNYFLFYRLQEDNFMSLAEGAMTGAGGLKRVPSEVLNNFKFGLPSKKEQSIIVDFLKHETAKIDNLIEKQQQLIELLKEKRQAVISHAVTKGLNPDVPMKDSGVEWLGEVPEHWKVSVIKYVLTSQNSRRIPLSSEERDKRSGKYRYYGASGVIDYIDNYIFNESTVLVGEDGANLVTRNTPLAFSATGKYWVNNHAHILKPSDGLVDYWAEAIEHIDINPIVSGSAQPKLTSEALNNLKIVYSPVMEERQQIENYIKTKKKKYNNLISIAKELVTLLQERRTALISAAVTGKIDVRDWVAPNACEAEVSQEGTA